MPPAAPTRFPRPPRRVIVAIAIALLVCETLAVGLVVTRARAAVIRDTLSPASPMTDLDGAASATITTRPPAAVGEATLALAPAPVRHLLVRVDRPLPIRARPGAGRILGIMPTSSRFYGNRTVAWVFRVSRDGRYGRVDVPYEEGGDRGWIALEGLARSWTLMSVEADLSEHRITVRRGDEVLFRVPAATGAGSSPTPTGRYFVTDRVPFAAGSSLGTFAFGISGIQPRLPAGWTGGDQLAIHGTNDPSSIGRSASAGCLRVSEPTLARLRSLLRFGTPVIVHA